MKGLGLKFYIEIIRIFFCIDVLVMDVICEIILVKKWKKKWLNIIYFIGFFLSYKMFDSKMYIKILF